MNDEEDDNVSVIILWIESVVKLVTDNDNHVSVCTCFKVDYT